MLKYGFIVLYIFHLAVPSQAQSIKDTVKLPLFSLQSDKVSVPSSFSVIRFDSAILDQNSTTHLGELIERSTAVYVKNYGPGALSSLSLRGTAANHTQVFWNGISLNSSMLGQVDLALFPMNFIDELELHKGAGSIIDGSGGLGGSFQLANTGDFSNIFQLDAQTGWGSFDHRQFGGRVQWGNTKWQFRSIVYGQEAVNDFTYTDYLNGNIEVQRENADLMQFGGMQEAYYRPDEKNTLALRLWFYESDRKLPPILGSESNAESQFDQSLKTMLEWNHMGKKHYYELKLAVLNDQLDYENESLRLKTNSEVLSTQIYSRYTYLWNDQWEVITQLQLRNDEASSTGLDQDRDMKIYSNLTGVTRTSKNGRWIFDAFSRQEQFESEPLFWLPAIGSRYKIANNKNWYGSINAAKNIQFPSLNDRFWAGQGNPDLDVAESRSIEIGIANREAMLWKTKKWSFELILFHSYIDNWILWQPVDGVWRPENLQKVENKGMELGVQKRTVVGFSNFLAGLNYSYTDSRNLANKGNDENTVGKQLVYVPFHKVNGTLTWKRRGWSAWFRQSFTDQAFIDKQNSRYMPYFAPMDVNISRHFFHKNGNLEIGLRVRNLLDEEYQVIAERPMPGRNYLVTARYQIKHP